MSTAYQQAESGIQALGIDASLQAEALARLKQWLEKPPFTAYRPQIYDLIQRKQWSLLADCFYQVLPFGTGGRRGSVGIGPNRINPYTIASSVQGHAEYLKEQKAAQSWPRLAVVIAYDVRQFNDSRQVYSREVPNPCLGMRSRDFARLAAGVYAGNAIHVWMLPDDAAAVMSTPELSFCIRRLKAQGGLNISASHNPPDDNGAKVYNYTGGQEVPPYDEEMARRVETVDRIEQMDYEAAKAAGLVQFIPDEARRDYIRAVLAASLQPRFRNATIVFSPLHGAGKHSGGRALEEAGFKVVRVEAQWPDDGNFSHVPNRIANPEEPAAMKMAAETARQIGADLALATDPDADRMGAVAPDQHGQWHFLDGNQIGILLAYYILETRTRLNKRPRKPLVVKTEVTTSLLERLARAYDARIIGDLLVGFKYIGDILRQIEETGQYRGESYSLDDFLFGTEESHGYLVTPAIRDKDAAGACLLLAELAAVCKAESRTLIDYLEAIYSQFGFTRNFLVPTVMTGAEGTRRIQQIQNSLRTSPPNSIGRLKILRMTDLQDPAGRFGRILSETDRSSRNVLIFEMENGSRAIIRPSGTEPKNKIYFEATEKLQPVESLSALRARVDAAIQRFADDFTQEMLGRVGIRLSPAALRISGLVSLENKLDFEKFLPELEMKAREHQAGRLTRDELLKWTLDRLKKYGKEPFPLVAGGIKEYVAAELPPSDSSRQAVLRTMQALFEN